MLKSFHEILLPYTQPSFGIVLLHHSSEAMSCRWTMAAFPCLLCVISQSPPILRGGSAPTSPSTYRLGLNGLLNPPTRFIYCLYSVFFSFRIPDTLFPFTFVFFVDLNPVNPIAFLIAAISGSESTSISFVEAFGSGVTEAPLVTFEVPFAGGRGDLDDGGGMAEPRGPVGGAPGRGLSAAGLWGGLRDRVRPDERGGVRMRVRAGGLSLRGEAERLRGRSGRLDGGSSVERISNIHHSFGDMYDLYKPLRDLCLSLLLLRSSCRLSLAPSLPPSLSLL